MSVISLGDAAAGLAGYAPRPSDYDALTAVQNRMQEESALSYFATAGGIAGNANFPSDVRLNRCEESPSHLLPNAIGGFTATDGYECVIDVYPNGEPQYRVMGFFHFDGLDWRYYGPIRASYIVPHDKFGQSSEPGKLAPKEGSIIYEGMIGSMQNDNPYEAVLGDPDFFTSSRQGN